MQHTKEDSTAVKLCKFKLKLIKGTISILFPSYIFVQVRTLNNHALCQSKQILKSAKSTQIIFNQTIEFQTEMLFNQIEQTFLKKDMQIRVNLKSVKNPDEVKLVGSLKINLLDYMTYDGKQAKIKGNSSSQLQYARDKTLLQYDLALQQISQSLKKPVDLDKSQFKDPQINRILSGSSKSIKKQQQNHNHISNHSHISQKIQKSQQIQKQVISTSEPPKVQVKLQKKVSLRSLNRKPTLTNSQTNKPTTEQLTEQITSPKKFQSIRSSIFQEQEQYIHNLQQQLQQTYEIAQQYQLQMQLMKKEVQEYEKIKPLYNQMEARIANFSNKGQIYVNANNQENTKALQEFKQKIQLFQRVIQEKQDIISAKDELVQQKNLQIELLDRDFKEYVELKSQQCQDLNSSLIESKSAYKSLQQRFESFGSQVQSKTKAKFQQEIESMKEQILKINQLHQKITELECKLASKQNQLFQQKQKNIELQLNVKASQQKCMKVKGQLEKVQKQHNTFMKKYEKYQIQANKAIEKAKNIQKEKYELTERIKNFELEKKQYRKSLDEEISTLKKQIAQWQLTYEQISNKNSELKFAVQSYQSTLTEQQSKFTKAISELQKRNSKYKKKQELLHYGLNTLEQQIRNINDIMNEKQLQIQQNNFTIQQNKAKINDLIDKNMFMERKLRMTLNELDSLKYQVKIYKSKMESNCSPAQQDIDYQNSKQAHLIVLQLANKQIMQKNNQLSTQCITLQSQIELQKQKLKELASIIQKNKKLSQKISKLQRQIQTHKQQEKKLAKQLSKSKNQAKMIQEQYINQKEATQKLSKEVGQLQELKFSLYAQNNQNQVQITRIKIQNQDLTQKCKILSKQREDLLQITIQDQQKYNILNAKISDLQSEINQNHLNNQTSQNKAKNPVHSSSSLSNQKDSQENNDIIITNLKKQINLNKLKEKQYLNNITNLQKQLSSLRKNTSPLPTSIKNGVNMNTSTTSTSNYQTKNKKEEDIKKACEQLQKLLQQRIKNRQSQNLMQILISNSEMSQFSHDQQFGKPNITRMMQEKSKILSRQLLKIKSMIVKSDYKSSKDKNGSSSQLIQRLKPCELIVNELVKLCENVADDYEMI